MSLEQTVPAYALTGGMGAGKSSVGRELAELGAVVIDADQVVRELNKPGALGFMALVNILGEEIVAHDGNLDTKKTAAVMFADPERKTEVERVVHPLVWEDMNSRVAKLHPDEIPVLEVPLLKPETARNVHGVIVVNTPIEIAVARLAGRGFSPEEALARINTQLTNEERSAMADITIHNDGSHEDLQRSTAGAWQWLQKDAQGRK